MGSLREYLEKGPAKPVIAGLAVVAIIAGVWMAWRTLGPSEAVSLSRQGRIVCAETGKAFDITLEEGLTYPVQSPYSGKKTGYPAEFCYWTKDGKLKKDPTPVLLNAWLGKRDATFCPDCGRLVVPHNPVPTKESNPPPLREQYRNRADSER